MVGAVWACTLVSPPAVGEHFGATPALVLLLSAVLMALFAAAVGWVAWLADEWSPALLASGCVAMAEGAVLHYAFGGFPGALAASEGAATAPLVGLVAGGFLFALAAKGYAPVVATGIPWPRWLLALVPLALAGVSLTLIVQPQWAPGPAARSFIGGLGAAAYLSAAVGFARAYRFLRLPLAALVAASSGAFAGVVIVAAAGGVRGSPDVALDAASIVAGALPIAGVLLEQRARPGLRTMVLGLSLPGAARSFRRGHPASLRRLLGEVSAKDADLADHLDRVANLSVAFGALLGLPPDEMRAVSLAAQAHDVGKLYIPRAILDKPSALTADEQGVMRHHSRLGAELLQRIPELRGVASAVMDHHERWDGAGYPNGAVGEELGRPARILAIVDVFDALTNARSYKQAWTTSDALAEIEASAGSQFDPVLVAAFVAAIRSGELATPQPGREPVSMELWRRRQRAQHRATRSAAA